MPPNIVMLVTDNQSPDSLGAYGNREHETPHLDRLARQGTLFLRAFCSSGMCSPARATLMTGLMPSQHGVHMAMPDDEVIPKADDYDTTREFPTLAWLLRDAGYQTAMVGKWHLGNYRCRGHGFDHWVAFPKGHTTDFHDNEVFVDGRLESVRGQHIVEHFSDRALDFVNSCDPDRPYFLVVNYDGPYVLPPTVVGADRRNPFFDRFEHRSFRPFPRLDDRMIASVAVPFDFDLDPAEEYTLSSAFNNLWWTVRIHNDQATRANIAAQNAVVDHAIGRVVDSIDNRGERDTVVVMTTDQSNPYGQRGLWGHPQWTDPPYMHDVTFNVPLIVRRPGSVPAQQVSDRIVTHADLWRTVLDIADVTVPLDHPSPGRSFRRLLEGQPPTGWVDEAYWEAETARSLRTPEYLYTNHLAGTGLPELYDLVDDPEQMNDVAAEPERAATVADLDARLCHFFATYSDARYDLWDGGTAQAMVSRYLAFKSRYGADWEVTMKTGPPYLG